MRRAAVLLASALAGARALAADDAALVAPPLLDAGADRVLARTVVPDDVRKVGEVRLVARGDATVVQTLLATAVLSRVVAEIEHKEAANWPANAPGYVDMARYLAALREAASTLRARREGAAGADRRLRLAIEFVADTRSAAVFLAEFEGDEVDGALRPTARRPLATLALSRAYVVRNMRFILADAFHVPEAELGRLGPLGPMGEVAP